MFFFLHLIVLEVCMEPEEVKCAPSTCTSLVPNSSHCFFLTFVLGMSEGRSNQWVTRKKHAISCPVLAFQRDFTRMLQPKFLLKNVVTKFLYWKICQPNSLLQNFLWLFSEKTFGWAVNNIRGGLFLQVVSIEFFNGEIPLTF